MRNNLLIFRSVKRENERSHKKVISPYLLLFLQKPVAHLCQGCGIGIPGLGGDSLDDLCDLAGPELLQNNFLATIIYAVRISSLSAYSVLVKVLGSEDQDVTT